MEQQIDIDKIFRRYLLDAVSDDERDRIEQEYLKETDVLDQLLAVEDDLIDEYLAKELDANERKQFELNLLRTPRQRERLAQAKLLLRGLEAPETDRVSRGSMFWLDQLAQRRVFALATVLLLIVATWFAVRSWQMDRRLQQMEAERVRLIDEQRRLSEKLSEVAQQKSETVPTPQAKESNTNKTPDTADPPQIATFVLPLVTTRGSGSASFQITGAVKEVQLQAQINDSGYKSFEAELQNADGQSIHRWKKLNVIRNKNGAAVSMKLPANELRSRNYILRVAGVSADGQRAEVGLYAFDIKQK